MDYFLSYQCEDSGDWWTEYKFFKTKELMIDHINENNIQPKQIIHCHEIRRVIELEVEEVVTKVRIKK